MVTATSQFRRLNPQAQKLRLDGHSFQFSSLKLNGRDFKHFEQDGESLSLNLSTVDADQFSLEVVSILSPEKIRHYKGYTNQVRDLYAM